VLLTFRYKKLRHLIAGEPALLVHNGRVFHDRMAREHITLDDLEAALRRTGVGELAKVRYAILEDNGQISVIPKAAPDPNIPKT
jgi:uncharacterized membrane protein YcaP (DUF421 family)